MRGLAEHHGFRVFERAFSRHPRTLDSISNMMNAEYAEQGGAPEYHGERFELERTPTLMIMQRGAMSSGCTNPIPGLSVIARTPGSRAAWSSVSWCRHGWARIRPGPAA